jgi:hypothetical protein
MVPSEAIAVLRKPPRVTYLPSFKYGGSSNAEVQGRQSMDKALSV